VKIKQIKKFDMNLLETTRLLFRSPETDDQTTLERVFCDPCMKRMTSNCPKRSFGMFGLTIV
jgi:hypothetical protein